MTISNNIKTKTFWTIASVVLLFNAFLCLVSSMDLYQVAFTDKEKEYHWGAEAMGWYYATRQTYTTYMGLWTGVFLIALAFQIYFAVKQDKVKELYSGLTFILLFVAMMVSNGPMD